MLNIMEVLLTISWESINTIKKWKCVKPELKYVLIPIQSYKYSFMPTQENNYLPKLMQLTIQFKFC
jgi:hypothetical protein